METAQILVQFAYVLNTIRDNSSIESFISQIGLRLRGRDGNNLETTLQISLFVGRISLRQGNYIEALRNFEEINNSRARALAEDYPDRPASQHELASAYEANGQIKEAVELLEHVVKVKEKLAEDHPSRLVSQDLLASFKNLRSKKT